MEGVIYVSNFFDDYSEKVAAEIDQEVAEIIDHAQKKAHEILSSHKHLLKGLSEKLIKEETIEGPEFDKLFK